MFLVLLFPIMISISEDLDSMHCVENWTVIIGVLYVQACILHELWARRCI